MRVVVLLIHTYIQRILKKNLEASKLNLLSGAFALVENVNIFINIWEHWLAVVLATEETTVTQCHEEVLYLQSMIPLDIFFLLTGGCLEGIGAF